MLPHHVRFPSRGSAGRHPAANGTMAPAPPPPGPNLGAFAELGQLPQDVVGAVVGNLRTSMLDVGTAVRLGWVGRRNYFGTELAPPQLFAAPSQTNSPDNVNAAVKYAGNARRAEGKNAARGLRRPSPGVMI
jgi:hypothetical protein